MESLFYSQQKVLCDVQTARRELKHNLHMENWFSSLYYCTQKKKQHVVL